MEEDGNESEFSDAESDNEDSRSEARAQLIDYDQMSRLKAIISQ